MSYKTDSIGHDRPVPLVWVYLPCNIVAHALGGEAFADNKMNRHMLYFVTYQQMLKDNFAEQLFCKPGQYQMLPSEGS